MEAKDSVLSLVSVANESLRIQMQRILEEQAQITWKAREPEIAEARKAGMREVVEWVRKQHLFIGACPPKEGEGYVWLGGYILNYGNNLEPVIGFNRLNDSPDWNAKLKNWGVDDAGE